MNARHICGKKVSRADNLNAYFEKRAKILGITLEQYLESIQKLQPEPKEAEERNFDSEIPF
jgi:hypothetical protein